MIGVAGPTAAAYALPTPAAPSYLSSSVTH